ncbi:YbjN domain-containing protein [Corynebacterium sp.]|uniref:YbjN domain-containing protein n=1 Tax=Corynebacterium sp. TaxID=1720 RepID=UPI002A91D3CD|nr:YbjN domain-containing protein [Corynebacterium sp.]MDY5785002.1 YbjN domain-containing protein [Corynebacterium sp.]
MAKHRAQGIPAGVGLRPAEVTLERVARAARTLGFEISSRPDRVVVSTHTFIATAWISYEKPLMLVIDCTQRIPIDFGFSPALATFLNTWNHDRVGPTASYRLNDSGDIDVHLRSGIRTRHGLTDEQLLEELCDAFEHMAAFSLQLREGFLPVEFDQPLPPTLIRAQDADALLGRHPSSRHLPRGQQLDVDGAPDYYAADEVGDDDDSDTGIAARETRTQPVSMAELEDVFETLDFAYSVTDDDVVATGVNGIPFAACIDADDYARITAMWDTGRTEGFLPLWLMCNSVNERCAGLRAYLHTFDGAYHLHVETTCLINRGMTSSQLHNFVLSSLVAILGAVDAVSTQCNGHSVVNWPRGR